MDQWFPGDGFFQEPHFLPFNPEIALARPPGYHGCRHPWHPVTPPWERDPSWQQIIVPRWQRLVDDMNYRWHDYGYMWPYIRQRVHEIDHVISNGPPAYGARGMLLRFFYELKDLHRSGPRLRGVEGVYAQVQQLVEQIGRNPMYI